jgi:hypothetical protein
VSKVQVHPEEEGGPHQYSEGRMQRAHHQSKWGRREGTVDPERDRDELGFS